MTDTPTPPEATTGTGATAEGTPAPEAGTATPIPPDAGTEPPGGDGGNANEEAKQYRLRLRETEQERDGLRTRLESAHRREVERLAAGSLADASDLWSTSQLADMLTEDGDVDTEKVTAAVDALVTAKPHYAKRGSTPKPDPSQGARGAVEGEQRMGDIFKKS